ncbi:hypothetical protein FNH22_07855 [Fulvivirga sp. M361]|uniref:FG-GAP-like repeat-containing protein n=1 Tax=Fulvivirga sp. M361 TaxID=2594266 RepID=UPI00117B33C3|nr:FG-GAP-like repeat-containing protein [Fulvivirga sp. M361]TRX59959.1 hypothetical protein FNH22_07855 [Fulvivirga sp. M361]
MKRTPIAIIILSVLTVVNAVKGQHFTEVAEATGIAASKHCNGVAVADYDMDGDEDIFFVAAKSFDKDDPSTWSRLYKNEGDHFVDVTIEAGFASQYINNGPLSGMGQKQGASWADYDNDGDPDLLLTHFRQVQLFDNNGDGTFTEVTESSGLVSCYTCHYSSGLWWDYDLDGDLDLYLSVWHNPTTDLHRYNVMYENRADGTFRDITDQLKIGDNGATWASVALDVNDDTLPDLYVVNDFGENRLYINAGPDLPFSEESEARGVNDKGDGMGVTIGDYNNNGHFDIFITNIDFIHPNALLTDNGDGYFDENSKKMKVGKAGWAWGTRFLDCDHDTDEDLYVGNGHFNYEASNVLFVNDASEGGTGFKDQSLTSNADGRFRAKGVEVFDFDNDGDLDIAVANWLNPPYLYRNEVDQAASDAKNWIKISLEGTVSNKNAFGSKVSLSVGDETFHRYHHGANFLGQSIKPVHFGLGANKKIDKIEITWPTGITETFFNVNANQTITIEENEKVVLSLTDAVAVELKRPYPNPFGNELTWDITIPERGDVVLKIMDKLGKVVYESIRYYDRGGIHQLRSDGLDTLSNGLFYYTITYNNTSVKGKLLHHGIR